MNKRTIGLAILFTAALFLGGCGKNYRTAMVEGNIAAQTADQRISATLMKRYQEDMSMSALGISADTYLGNVYLVGEYESETQRSNAVAIAQRVEGVKRIDTFILPKKEDPTCHATDNMRIREEVKAALIRDSQIWSTHLEVKTVQCQVVLIGLVGSSTEISKSIGHARSVPGMRGVKSFLRVAN